MATQGRLYLILAILVATLLIRMHGAAAASGDAENGRLAAQARCTACHSVERETAGTGSFAPDFTVIARRRSALWLHAFLRGPHVLMPDFAFQGSGEDDLVAYIVSLKRR